MSRVGRYRRLMLFVTILVSFPSLEAYADWTGPQSDGVHSGFLESGPAPPLRLLWRYVEPGSSGFTAWPITDGRLIFARQGRGVVAVDRTGKRRWFALPEEGPNIVSPAFKNGRLFIPVDQGRLLALDGNSGNSVWKFQGSGAFEYSPVVRDSLVYVGSTDGALYAIDSDSGQEVWRIQLDGRADSVPSLNQDTLVVLIEKMDSQEAQIAAFDASTGEEFWTAQMSEEASSPAILDDKVIVGGGDFNAYALDIETGKVVWKSRVYGKFDGRNMPALAYGDAFLADRVGNVYRINGSTGKRIWMFDKTIGTFDQSSPVVVGKTVYIGSSAGWLYALDADSGELRWKEQVGGFILSGAADEERFYFGVKFGKAGLYAYEHDPEGKLEPNTGKLALWVALGVIAVLLVGIVYLVRRKRLPNL